MNRILKPAGAILYGREVLTHLPSELSLAGVRNPRIFTAPENVRVARRIGRLLRSDRFPRWPVIHRDPPADTDALIFLGGLPEAVKHAGGSWMTVFIPLSAGELEGLEESAFDCLILDRRFISDRDARTTGYFRRTALRLSGGLSSFPGTPELPPAFVYHNPTEIFSGHSSLEELPALFREKLVRRPLIITDRGIAAAGILDRLLEAVPGEMEPVIFQEVPPDSDSGVVNRISRIFREEDRDVILALGGGSVLDTAKGVLMNVSLGGEDLLRWRGSGRLPRLEVPFIAVPTTSGTGSESTRVAVIAHEEEHRKMLFVSPFLQPDYGILDSRLTLSLPPHLTAMTGMDALSHAVEAFICLGRNPLSDQLAWTAVELIREHLAEVTANPGDQEGRLALALASNLAGQAFSNSMVGMVHTIGHSIGAVCRVPHGICMALLLPLGMEYNLKAAGSRLSLLLDVLDPSAGSGLKSGKERADRAVEAVRDLNRRLNGLTGGRHPLRLRDWLSREGVPAVTPEDFDRIARTALGDGSIVYNPEELRYGDIMKVLEQVY